MFYLVSAFSADTLRILTDLTTGLVAIDIGLKLNGPAETFSLDPFCAFVSGGLELNDAFVGLRRFGSVAPSGLLGGNDSANGDRVSWTSGDVVEAFRRVSGVSGSSDGGVGVRGA